QPDGAGGGADGDGVRVCPPHRRQRAARRPGGQGTRRQEPRHGSRDGAAGRAARQPAAGRHRGRRRGPGGVRREAAAPVQGALAMSEARPLPLAGVVVVDLGQIYNGPYATFLMAMAGARVIKIEPREGEHLRRRGVVGGAALPFAMLNSSKECVTLNLKTERGRELLVEMVRRGDVLVENFAPGTMDRLGLGPDRLIAENPRLVYASGSGYGSTGPYRDYPAMDLTVQAMSGVMSITGFPDRPPVKAGPALCDFFAGVHLYSAVVTALYERERTGTGRRVEVSMLESVYCSLSSSLGLWWGSGGEAPPRTGNRHGGMAEAPYNVYPTRDGHIAIICVGENHWRNLARVMGREDLADDPRFCSLARRVENIDEIDEIVSEFTSRHDK